MRTPTLFCLLLYVLLSPLNAWCAAGAQETIVERQLRHVVVEENGAHTLIAEKVVKLGSGSSALAHARQHIGYRADKDQLALVAGHTEKPDGQRITVTAAMVDKHPLAHAPLLGNTHEAVVSFPEAQPGDRLVLRYIVRRHSPLLAGHFDDIVTDEGLVQRDFQVIYDVPSNLVLHADAIGFAPIAAPHPEGRRRHAWQYAAATASPLETGAVSVLDVGNRLAVSTTAGYETLAQKVHQQLQHVMQDSAVSGHAWPVGVGAVLQRANDLAGKGMQVRLALVNHGNAYTLTDVPTLTLLNHLLLYLPQSQQYLDVGSAQDDDGRLPAAVLGKPALLTDPAGFAMLPFSQPRRLQVRGQITIARDGKRIERVATTTADADSALRTALAPLMVLRERQLPFVCPAIDASDEIVVQLAPGVRPWALPRQLAVDDGNFAYRARYRRQGQQVLVERSFVFRHTGPTCLPEDLARMQPALARVRRDLGTELIIQRAGR